MTHQHIEGKLFPETLEQARLCTHFCVRPHWSSLPLTVDFSANPSDERSRSPHTLRSPRIFVDERSSPPTSEQEDRTRRTRETRRDAGKRRCARSVPTEKVVRPNVPPACARTPCRGSRASRPTTSATQPSRSKFKVIAGLLQASSWVGTRTALGSEPLAGT